MSAGEPTQYATKTEVQSLTAQIAANTAGLAALSTGLVEVRAQMTQILTWLRGGWDTGGDYEPGLIEQNRRITSIVSRATRIGIWLLSAIALAATSNAVINLIAHFYPALGPAK